MVTVLFVNEQVILAATAQVPSVMAVMNLATLHRTASTRFLPEGNHTTKTDTIQGIDIPTSKETYHTPPIMVSDMADISAGQVLLPFPLQQKQ